MTLIGLDANILLRAMLNDDTAQSPMAKNLLSSLGPERPGYIGVSVVLEIFWVLKRRYRVPKNEIADVFDAYLTIEHIEFESFDAIKRALSQFREEAVDFPDVLLAERNRADGCEMTMTFDQNAARRVNWMELLQ
ncbi:hypothetical protein B7H23_06880 [Notoacmeibacter marinus]|uniref:PIN domain-containing protein n=1 Tax=Notoacmeibacter marinus TaxID=1876515 RepID=A0A231V350_9HYPH|nr:type II toxin-antitoxin system VapC family toxin [Notoacmeibacter marinus]OXT02608.1 hypothetical protein B7H23_06880 [Notoacmeibacter marinus]